MPPHPERIRPVYAGPEPPADAQRLASALLAVLGLEVASGQLRLNFNGHRLLTYEVTSFHRVAHEKGLTTGEK